MKNLKFYFLFFVAAMLPLFSSVTTIKSLAEIPVPDNSQETIAFFDLDDTLIDFPHMLGSKAWRRYISKVGGSWHDLCSLDIAYRQPMVVIEPISNDVLEQFVLNGIPVCGLTSRERTKWYDIHHPGNDLFTLNQLKVAGIHFDSAFFAAQYPNLAQAPEYFEGVFFVNMESKGDYLKQIFSSEKPKKIIFVDDKLGNVKAVDDAMKELGVNCEAYFYCGTEAKSAAFDPLIANIQLYYFYHFNVILSDEQAASIAKTCSHFDLLEILKKFGS